MLPNVSQIVPISLNGGIIKDFFLIIESLLMCYYYYCMF